MDDNEAILVCMREGAPRAPHVEESLLKTCSKCGHNVWVTPASLLAAGPEARLTCIQCVGEDVCVQVIKGMVQDMTEAQLREISEVLGRKVSQEEAAEAIRIFERNMEGRG